VNLLAHTFTYLSLLLLLLLWVQGKNGVTVNGTLCTPASGPCVLQSQDLLQAGDGLGSGLGFRG
jgi:hypothetical protein